MMLPLAALLFATGCGKNVSYEEACKFVKETYADKTAQTSKGGTFEFQGKANDPTTKEAIKQMLERLIEELKIEVKLDDNLHAKADLDPTEIDVLTVDGVFPILDGTDAQTTYTIKGKSFTQSMHEKGADSSTGIQMEAWLTEDYNDNGLLTKEYAKELMKQNNQEVSFEATVCWVF